MTLALPTTVRTFADLVEAADALSEEQKRKLVGILREREAAREQERLEQSLAESKEALRAGQLQPRTAAQIMQDAQR